MDFIIPGFREATWLRGRILVYERGAACGAAVSGPKTCAQAVGRRMFRTVRLCGRIGRYLHLKRRNSWEHRCMAVIVFSSPRRRDLVCDRVHLMIEFCQA